MTSAKATFAPFSMMVIGLVFILLATLAVVQTQSVTVSPVESDLSSLFETKTGQLTLQAPPYCGQFDVFCFVVFVLQRVLARLAEVFGGLSGAFFGGLAPAAASTSTSTSADTSAKSSVSAAATVTADESTCAEGRAGRDCRRAERKEARDARQEAREQAREARLAAREAAQAARVAAKQ